MCFRGVLNTLSSVLTSVVTYEVGRWGRCHAESGVRSFRGVMIPSVARRPAGVLLVLDIIQPEVICDLATSIK